MISLETSVFDKVKHKTKLSVGVWVCSEQRVRVHCYNWKSRAQKCKSNQSALSKKNSTNVLFQNGRFTFPHSQSRTVV